MSGHEVGLKMRHAFETVGRILDETSLLMQTVEGLMAPDFRCPCNRRGVWGQYGYDAGKALLVTYIARCWQRVEAPRTGILLSMEFLPDRSWACAEDPGPVATATVLRLTKPMDDNNWSTSWLDNCGWNEEYFQIDMACAPLYRSVPKAETDLTRSELLEAIENFWIPLDCLTGRREVEELLVRPLKEIANNGIGHLGSLAGPYLCVAR